MRSEEHKDNHAFHEDVVLFNSVDLCFTFSCAFTLVQT